MLAMQIREPGVHSSANDDSVEANRCLWVEAMQTKTSATVRGVLTNVKATEQDTINAYRCQGGRPTQ